MDTGQVGYGGVLVVDVPADAAGTYAIDYFLGPPTFMIVDREQVTIGELRPGIIKIASGRCCVPLTAECIPNATQISCDAVGGDFVLDGECVPGVCCEDAGPGSPDCNDNGAPDLCEIAVLDCNGNLQPDDCDVANRTSPDCNGNLTPDECELAVFDCNGNLQPDDCDVADGTSLDCNDNLAPDECDIASGSSSDCNFDLIPDDCQPDEDCNNNSISDICDIGAGTSGDCNFDLVPDDCQPDEDCNTNGTTDICDIGAGTSADCNNNFTPDECDIASSASLDDNGDGVPDECCVSPMPIFVQSPKSRYLSLTGIGTTGVRSAIRVSMGPNESFPEVEGNAFWVGRPVDSPEENSGSPGLTFVSAGLSCDPHFHDWSAVNTLQVYGAEIVPSSVYFVQVINEACPNSFEDNFSAAVQADTSALGDMIAPFFPDGLPQPNFIDITGSVSKFLATPGAPIKASAQLVPNTPFPNESVSFLDINSCVRSFLGEHHVDIVLNAQSCECPSVRTCGVEPCLGHAQCANGFCVDGFCTDACSRCTP